MILKPPQRRKLEGNGLWESSRMIIPEHKLRIISEERNQVRRVKPELDEFRLAEIERGLRLSLNERVPVTITMYDPFEEPQYKGIVLSVDRQLRQIKLRWSEDDWDWIKIEDILAVSY
ncbi:YolD-like family protein [Paenibacillus donghaensis]|uniref:YolD-like family protein n=1 Tax=Paenibacillus donghaensis TaxID=414771 RepID=A0A2Z2KFV0_9BACL|nr:YolD-like family protein [Paenibacillus donghaensis]ASA22053.1 hypothetical protein B9T62_15480 [Paenibacillus donghaensis]